MSVKSWLALQFLQFTCFNWKSCIKLVKCTPTKGSSINYVTLKSGKIDSPPPPVTPPSRMHKKLDAPLPATSRFWVIFTSPPSPPKIENLNKESRNKVNFKRMFSMLRKQSLCLSSGNTQCTLLMQNSEDVEEKKYWAWRHGFSWKHPTPPCFTVTHRH